MKPILRTAVPNLSTVTITLRIYESSTLNMYLHLPQNCFKRFYMQNAGTRIYGLARYTSHLRKLLNVDEKVKVSKWGGEEIRSDAYQIVTQKT